jgi:hypothetical protein
MGCRGRGAALDPGIRSLLARAVRDAGCAMRGAGVACIYPSAALA